MFETFRHPEEVLKTNSIYIFGRYGDEYGCNQPKCKNNVSTNFVVSLTRSCYPLVDFSVLKQGDFILL